MPTDQLDTPMPQPERWLAEHAVAFAVASWIVVGAALGLAWWLG